MSAVLGGDADEVARRDRGGRAATRPTATAPARSSPPARSPGWRSSPPRRRPRPGSSRCRWPARSTPRTWPRPRRPSPRSPAASRRPTPTGSCCPTRTVPASTTAPTMLARLVAPGHRAGALGPVHAHPGRPRRHRRHRAAAGRHPGRAGQARAQGQLEIVTVNTPDDLTAARDLIARHGMAPSHEPTMALRARGGHRRRHVRAAAATSPRAPGQGRSGARPHHHPPGQRRGDRARLGRAHRMARPPRRPGRVRASPSPASEAAVTHESAARASSASATTSRRGCSPTTTSRRWSTPTTRGSATGSASPTRRIAAADETVADMAARRRREGAGQLRPHRGRHRPGRRGHLLLGGPLPERGHPGGRQARHRRPGRVRPQHRLLRLLLRAGHRRPRDPGRRRPQRHRHRRREALRHHRLDRPVDLPSSSATAPAPRWSPRPPTASRPASARWSGAPPRTRATPSGSRAGGRTSSRRARRSSAGPPPRSPRSRCRPASGPASTRARSPRSWPTRPTRASSTASPSG